MTDDIELQAARDAAWLALRSSPVRRSILGRERCDAIVRVAMEEAQYESTVCGTIDATDAAIRIRRRVAHRYAGQCGFAFSTLILSWAISAIVQALVVRWWRNRK